MRGRLLGNDRRTESKDDPIVITRLLGCGLLLGCTLMMAMLPPAIASAEDVRYFVENGVTFAETTRMVRRPVIETNFEERQRTVYRRQCQTEMRDTYRTVMVPVTEYRRESRWVGRWNPFVEPYLVEYNVPRTRWEPRTEVVKTPFVTAEMVPETLTERVPVITQRIVEQPVVSRVAVSGRTPAFRPSADPFDNPTLAQRPSAGGLKLESDPPRQGARSEWRPATKRR